jgi:phosphohistidine phosphatase
MKTIYFVQHGIARPAEVDQKRPLSDIGNAEVHKVATSLREHKVPIRKICHSGKLRAKQTATIFSEILGVAQLTELSGMAPNDNPAQLIEQISEDGVMYIGHLPHLSRVVAQLVSGDATYPLVKFQNAAVLCMEMDESSAAIKWFITADMC